MTAPILFLAIFAAAIAIWRSGRFYEDVIIALPPLIQHGLDATCSGSFVKAADSGSVNPTWFHSRTLILGYDTRNMRGPAEAVFRFSIPSSLRSCKDADASLTVQAERIHGGLHSHLGPKQVRALIEANGKVIDEVWLIDKMPNGEDYGFRNVGPIPIDANLLAGSELLVKLKVDDQTAWDIDQAMLQINVERRRLTVHGSMVLGALISAGIGLLPAVLERVGL